MLNYSKMISDHDRLCSGGDTEIMPLKRTGKKRLTAAFITSDKSLFHGSTSVGAPLYLYDNEIWKRIPPCDYLVCVFRQNEPWHNYAEIENAATARGIKTVAITLPGGFDYISSAMSDGTPKGITDVLIQCVSECNDNLQVIAAGNNPASGQDETLHDKNTPQQTDSSKVNDSNIVSPAKLAFNTINDFYDLIVPDKKLTPAEIAVSGFIFRHVDWRTCEARIAITRIAEPMKKTDRYITTVLDSLVAKQVFAKSRGYGRTVNTYTPLLSDGSFMAGVDVNKFTISKK